jgi:inositol phosphorylceramide mannosyltransferase catalytic subunit
MAIPKIIHQTVGDKSDIHPVFRENIARLQAINEAWDYRLYDDEDIRKFLRDNYDPDVLRGWERINPVYGAARADFFRYLLLHKSGGVYLDIKSTVTQRLDDVLSPSDSYILSHWNANYKDWGRFPELDSNGEYQQWHIVASRGHPFLEAVISRVKANIDRYNPSRDGVGKRAIMRVTGPVAYTLAISGIRKHHAHRCVDIEDLGFRYSIVETRDNQMAHELYFKTRYRDVRDLVILPQFVDERGNTIDVKSLKRNEPCPCGSGSRYKHCHGVLF